MQQRLLLCLIAVAIAIAQEPPITTPAIIATPELLPWPRDFPVPDPKTDLTEPTSNRLFDLHGSIKTCDLVVSTAGNYHMALRELIYDHLLPANPDIETWYYSTSPPITPDHIENGIVTFANLAGECSPQIAVGPGGVMNAIEAGDYTRKFNGQTATRVPLFENNGNVILVKKGNPKNIQSIWDLGNSDVRFCSSNADTEPGSFGNYRSSVYNIAAQDPAGNPNDPSDTAEALFNRVFNEGRWTTGERIHHREVPWLIAFDKADAGLIFYHLAKYMVDNFPDTFEVVPLGGTYENPAPLPGNRIGKLFAVELDPSPANPVPWTLRQDRFTNELMTWYLSDDFTSILQNFGMKRPADFDPDAAIFAPYCDGGRLTRRNDCRCKPHASCKCRPTLGTKCFRRRAWEFDCEAADPNNCVGGHW